MLISETSSQSFKEIDVILLLFYGADLSNYFNNFVFWFI